VLAAGLGLEELAGLSAEMYERARSGLPGRDEDRDFEGRCVKLATTFGGAGVVRGDLARECAQMVGRVLDALGAPRVRRTPAPRAGGTTTRWPGHAASRLGRAATRAGRAPVKARAHVSLAGLLLDGDSALQQEWTARVRQRRAAHRAKASQAGAGDGAWLDGDAAAAIACDAATAPS
jgi:hypothetical protein